MNDFVVKNAVEVGKDTKVTLGTITSSNIDLSTGNYFNDTLAANTTYTISNAGDVQSFQLEVTGGAFASLYDINNAAFVRETPQFYSGTQDTAPQGISVSSDGLTALVVGDTNNKVYEYSMSTAHNISTATLTRDYLVTSQTSQPTDIYVSPDGTKMFLLSQSGYVVVEYTLNAAWSLSSVSYVQNSPSISSQETAPRGLTFSKDGLHMYLCGDTSDKIHHYTLSTAWDVSTLSYTGNYFDVVSIGANPRGLAISQDGTKLLWVSNATSSLKQANLSSAFDISTASNSGFNNTLGGYGSDVEGIYLTNYDSKMYTARDGASDRLYQYTSGEQLGATLTWPTSIEWAGGGAPAAPATGETDLFTISTDDGGTTYIGLKTADNLS